MGTRVIHQQIMNQPTVRRYAPQFLTALMVFLAFTTACAFVRRELSTGVSLSATRTPWPTFTPIAASMAATAQNESGTGAAANIVLSEAGEFTPTVTRTPRPTFTPATGGSQPTGQPIVPNTAAMPLPASAPENNQPVQQPSLPEAAVPNQPAQAVAPTATAGAASARPSLPDTPTAITTVPEVQPATPTDTPVPIDTPTPIQTAATASPVPVTENDGWVFSNLRLSSGDEELVIFGEITNRTGRSHQLDWLTGTFYNQQGQLIAGDTDTYDMLPIDLIPPDGQVPFQLIVEGIDSVADYTLQVESEPVDETPRQHFEPQNLSQQTERGEYCLSGALGNPGDAPDDYIIIALILYNAADQVINYGDYYEFAPDDFSGAETLAFTVCADPLGQPVARHDVRAWGE